MSKSNQDTSCITEQSHGFAGLVQQPAHGITRASFVCLSCSAIFIMWLLASLPHDGCCPSRHHTHIPRRKKGVKCKELGEICWVWSSWYIVGESTHYYFYVFFFLISSYRFVLMTVSCSLGMCEKKWIKKGGVNSLRKQDAKYTTVRLYLHRLVSSSFFFFFKY